jgi:hypothetical protein
MGHRAIMGALRYSYKNLARKSEGNRPIGRLNIIWDSFKMDINDAVWEV